MASAAKIPFLFGSFFGCISVVMYGVKEYRLATYKGARVQKCGENTLELKQGKHTLAIDIFDKTPQKLLAPEMGDMCRTIHESTAKARFRLYENGKILFEAESGRASCEYSDVKESVPIADH
jgi:hypothetical protein